MRLAFFILIAVHHFVTLAIEITENTIFEGEPDLYDDVTIAPFVFWTIISTIDIQQYATLTVGVGGAFHAVPHDDLDYWFILHAGLSLTTASFPIMQSINRWTSA